jgi:hypothetical protein
LPPQDAGTKRLPPEVEEQLDRRASELSKGDVALWFHHRALLLGGWGIYQREGTHWSSYLRTKKLDQYLAVEESVIQGWRRFVQNTAGIPPETQRDPYAVNCAIVLDWLRRKRGSGDVRDIFRRRANTFSVAAKKGDANFFRAVGRLLGQKAKSDHLQRFDYAHGMLSHWLTESFWLMPAKIASHCLATRLGVPDNIKTFLAFKSRYGLKSHKPSLVAHLETESAKVARLVLTRRGKLLLR